MMKNIYIAILLLVTSFVSVAKVDNTNPYVLIKQVANNTFERLRNEHEQIRQQPNLLKEVIREEMLDHIDYRYAAYKVLGSHLKKTTAQERDQFAEVFRDYIVTSYAQIFTLYDDQKVEFESTKDFSQNRIVSVSTKVIDKVRAPIDIDFKVRQNKSTGEWKAYDIVAEGISMLDSKSAELNSILRQKGISTVSTMLVEKSTRDIRFESKGE